MCEVWVDRWAEREGKGEYSAPLSVWPCGPPWQVGKHKGAQTAIGPSQSPSRSLETARPVGRASAVDFCPGAKVSGSRTYLLTHWYDGWAEIIPFRYLQVLLGRKGGRPSAAMLDSTRT
jgi:hypothetical protein